VARPLESESLDSPSIHPLWAILLAVGGFLIGLGIMYIEAWSTEGSEKFVGTLSGRLWILLIAAQVAFWAVVALPLWKGLRKLHRAFREQLRGLGLQSALFAVVFVGLLRAAPLLLEPIENPLVGHEAKITLISAIGVLVVGVPALLGMFWVRVVAEAFSGSITREEPDREGNEYTYLRGALERLLRLVGVVIALSTLSTGALQQALVEFSGESGAFPPQLVLLWGAGSTVLLMLAYVPAYLSLRKWGEGLVAHLLPMPVLGSTDWFDWNAKAKDLSSYLQLDKNLLDRLQSGIFILAPLLSAAITVAIPR
jgi:hypothetical protein